MRMVHGTNVDWKGQREEPRAHTDSERKTGKGESYEAHVGLLKKVADTERGRCIGTKKGIGWKEKRERTRSGE